MPHDGGVARIIVAEDDIKQARLVRSYLERDDHSVIIVHDGQAALDEVRARTPDLVLLDVMMPGLDGLEVCRVLRQEGSVPIIMVTARSEEDDQLLGFELGVDDYVTKPYSMRQLMARVKAVLRRAPGAEVSTEVISIGGLSLDRERCQVTVDGRIIELTPRELSILEVLAERPGRVFSRQVLLDEVAGFDHYALERTVDMHVMNLRRKIELDPGQPKFLLTVKGRGYKLAEGGAGAS
jgi:DNA-binding response OmpR family regulator